MFPLNSDVVDQLSHRFVLVLHKMLLTSRGCFLKLHIQTHIIRLNDTVCA